MTVQELLDKKKIYYQISGNDFKVCCLNPEHDDSNPSMRIDKVLGVFNCLSCGFKGNIFYHFGERVDKLDTAREKLKRKLTENELNIETEEGKSKALQIIQQEVNSFKKGGRVEGEFPERWLPASIGVVEEPFTEQNRMINSIMKMVRGKITEHYREKIDFLYTPDSKDITNEINKKALVSQ